MPASWLQGAKFAWIRRSNRPSRTALIDCRAGGGPILEMGVEYSGPSFSGWASKVLEEPDANWQSSDPYIRISCFRPDSAYSDRCCTWYAAHNAA